MAAYSITKLSPDITIKFHDQSIFAHKAILSQKSQYFLTAFTSQFLVATAPTIDLGDDEEPVAIEAMIRYLYDLSYRDVARPTGGNILMFHVDVFAAADKYDIPTLRSLVVQQFSMLLAPSLTAKIDEFCQVIQRLCGPLAVQYADSSLQETALSFCDRRVLDLIKRKSFVNMLEEQEPFAGRLLTGLLSETRGPIPTYRCRDCIRVPDYAIKSSLSGRCVNCATHLFGVDPPTPFVLRYKTFLLTRR